MDKKDFNILQGNALDILKTLPDESVQMCVTSPPYYNLRDYGTGKWEGGDPNCPHYRTSKYSPNCITGHKAMGEQGEAVGDAIYKTVCPLCGAVRVDEQIGLEETPEEYIQKLVDVFHEVKRVLKDDGTLWVNIGDSYATHASGSKKHPHNFRSADCARDNGIGTLEKPVAKSIGMKEKDLIGIPWMLAFALRADGWYLRQDIIWQKPNPMPESVTDRCTKSHEYIFLLSKSSKYCFNAKAIEEDAVSDPKRYEYPIMTGSKEQSGAMRPDGSTNTGGMKQWTGKRNKRDVWSINTHSYSGAHFATYPEELVTPCVLAGSNEGDIVLDCFNGSGTTGIVALKNNRKYIGIELNPDYIKLSDERFDETFNHKKALTDVIETDGMRKVDLLGD